MSRTIRGRAWVVDDYIDTDQIISGKYLRILDYEEMARHALEIPRPGLAEQIRPGDVIVAGRNFGGGSSREEAPRVLQVLGIGCVIAESFARLFYRNAFNIGLPALILRDAHTRFNDGENVTVDVARGEVRLEERGVLLHCEPVPPLMMRLLEAGGAVALYKMRTTERVSKQE